ncbi:MAG: sigma-70 family RNA polymerase sigma factor [Acidimicrobiales bacterium]
MAVTFVSPAIHLHPRRRTTGMQASDHPAPASASAARAHGSRTHGAATADPVSVDLQRAGQGDQAAFARVVDALGPIVHGLALRTLRAEALAEEVTQDVFLEAWRLAPRFDPARGGARAWLATIAHRRAVDRVRSEQARRNREDRDGATAVRPFDGVSEAVVDRLDRSRVAAALLTLSEPQRQAIGLAYYEGHTYREVATVLGIAEGTAKTRIRDGLRTLRAALGASS